jgi:drug/metabolite transporter (DMT)-like permease
MAMRWILNQGYILMIATSVAWASNSVIGRAVHDVVPPIGLAFWRWAATLPFFIAVAWPYMRRDWPVLLANWRWMAFLATLGIAMYNTIIYFGLDHTTAINMVLINALRPAVIVLLSFLIYRVTVGRLQTLGLVFGFIGTMIILARGDWAVLFNVEFNIGDLWICVATFTWAVYTVFLPKRPKIHPASFMAYSVLLGILLLLPFYIWETVTVEAVPLTAEALWAIGGLAVFASVIGHMGYNRIVDLMGANVAGATSYLVMAFGVLMAIVFLDEDFHTFHAAGLALLVVGSYLATRKEAVKS